MFQRFSDVSGLSGEPAFADLPFAVQVDRRTELERQQRYLPKDARGQAILET